MRRLNAKQKKLLNKWFKENYTGAGSIGGIIDLPVKTFDDLEEINDFETIYQHTDNYIADLACEYTHWSPDFEGQTMAEQQEALIRHARISTDMPD